MENEKQPVDYEAIAQRKQEILTEMTRKTTARAAMIESGMEMEPESKDMDLQDLQAELDGINAQLAENPEQREFQI